MGSDDNLTTEDFEKAAKAAGQSVKQAKMNTYEALKQELDQ